LQPKVSETKSIW